MKNRVLGALAGVALVLLGFAASAQSTQPKGHIWGYTFGDMYYKVGGDTLYWGKAEYAKTEKGALGGKLRRLYFGYDYAISDKLSARVLMESNASNVTGNGKFGFAVKLGMLEWKNAVPGIPGSTVRVGLIPTPVFAFPEKAWGYRSVEKEALDLRGFSQSADQGISFSGNFDEQGSSGFVLMVGNGDGNKPGSDKYLEYYGSVFKKFLDGALSLEVMANYKNFGNDMSRAIIRGFLSIERKHWRLGAEVSQSLLDQSFEGKGIVTTKPLLASVFFTNDLPFIGEHARLFLRYDLFDPDTNYDPALSYEVSKNYDEHLFLAGLHFTPHPKVNIIPNLYVNIYEPKKDGIVERKPDVVLRTTLYYRFGDR